MGQTTTRPNFFGGGSAGRLGLTNAENFNTIQMSFDMKEKGILSEEEFENIKKAMLDKISKQ